MANTQGYIVINDVFANGPSPEASASACVLAADGTQARYALQVIFAYGDPVQKIRQSLVDSLQSVSGIPDLDVNFITG